MINWATKTHFPCFCCCLYIYQIKNKINKRKMKNLIHTHTVRSSWSWSRSFLYSLTFAFNKQLVCLTESNWTRLIHSKNIFLSIVIDVVVVAFTHLYIYTYYSRTIRYVNKIRVTNRLLTCFIMYATLYRSIYVDECIKRTWRRKLSSSTYMCKCVCV